MLAFNYIHMYLLRTWAASEDLVKNIVYGVSLFLWDAANVSTHDIQ